MNAPTHCDATTFGLTLNPEQLRAATFRAIEKGYKPPDSIPNYAPLFMPHMRLVRADPRFMTQAARLGLVDYWLETGHWPDFCTEEKLPYDCKKAALAERAANNSARPRSESTLSSAAGT